jgi:lysophospholipase L1-like esterase
MIISSAIRSATFWFLYLISGWLFFAIATAAPLEDIATTKTINAEVALAISIVDPRPYQVVQRKGYVPQFAHGHQPGGAATGYADVRIQYTIAETFVGRVVEFDTLQYRTRLFPEMTGQPNDWQSIPFLVNGTTVTALARISAGGWYHLDLRCLNNGQTIAEGSVQPVGVGELFLIAGQSYATNTNEEILKVSDAGRRVAAYNFRTMKWQVANDPQPTADQSDGGSIWPAFGDLLVSTLQVPVGMANVAYGGTSSAQWQPDNNLFAQLAETGRNLKPFRSVLWQQGESDVIGRVSVDDYFKNITTLRDAASKAWGYSTPWLLAKSTLHPTVYNDPAGESRIRQAIERLVAQPGFLPGPDTDVLDGEHRGGPNSRRHFTGIGQRNAAALWFASVLPLINQPRPNHEVVLRALPELHLLEPSWNSSVVYRESSVLIQVAEAQPPTARLAFEASKVLAVTVASSSRPLMEGRDWTLCEDRRTLIFPGSLPLDSISAEQMFPPSDTPNSYRHRASDPQQNLLYQPGRWFHDRNIEINYQRAGQLAGDAPADSTNCYQPELMKRTLAKLQCGQPLHIAISGDSISTGLDASFVSFAPPYQMGYPELVAAQIQDTFNCQVALTNRAVAGWSVANGNQDTEAMIAARPDLIIIAYGMNDVGRRDPDWYAQQTRQLVATFQSRLPEADILLVASMLGNAEWIHTPREMFARYRDELRKLTGPGVALADLTEVWQLLLRHKHDLDLTGNGLNHPNDFGHRLYAQAILSVLVEKK